mmetsp:Transcript_11948/g.35781  ORF Transcript_11948/g.35781 Transcript_11948/m.35781 type:complete len:87 (-) Transcript_11948:2000-2260(-)
MISPRGVDGQGRNKHNRLCHASGPDRSRGSPKRNTFYPFRSVAALDRPSNPVYSCASDCMCCKEHTTGQQVLFRGAIRMCFQHEDL